MVIPGCNSGNLNLNRGGDGGLCEQKENDGICLNMRGCYDNSLFKEYPPHDIIISDENNKCKVLAPVDTKDYSTHQAVVVGWGRSSIYEYAVVK
jgi:hypothetical protein